MDRNVSRSDERLARALEHVRDAVERRGCHSLTSCPLHSRAMCDYYDVLTAQTDDGDIPDGIWEQAVAEVDGECGYVLEFAPDSIAHRLAYRERAEEIVASLTTEDETVFPGFPTND